MWNRIETDYIIVGSGIAGLTLSLLASKHGRIALVTKGTLENCNSNLAQGGIAAALSSDDSPFLHGEDTIRTGQGLCINETVNAYVGQAARAIDFLKQLGLELDAAPDGTLLLGKEGAHSRNRIVHAGGDATGRLIMERLRLHLHTTSNVRVWENTQIADLLIEDGECKGVVGFNASGIPYMFLAKAVVLATGGLGQLYKYTTNAPCSTGDGYSLAYRAGAVLRDMEFVQFHPTALRTDSHPLPLVSEAVRGEGATLVNSNGEPFMLNYHEWGDLASRDIVSRSIYSEMQAGRKVYLDARGIANFQHRFPTIYQSCSKIGINPTHDRIPVVPAAHYTMGGIQTDDQGKTSVPRLFAIGEAASSGFHGANRLASNSLLEGLLMAQRTVNSISSLPLVSSKSIEPPFSYRNLVKFYTFSNDKLVRQIKDLMWKHVGIVRNETNLQRALDLIKSMLRQQPDLPCPDRHLLTSARLVVEAALWRHESRGAHFRKDYPDARPDFQTHSIQGGTDESVTRTAVYSASTH